MAMAVRASGADPRPSGLTLPEPLDAEVAAAVLGLDTWFDSMRMPGGYGGPVVHWWNDCLEYTGPGLDWRYEGLIIGYLNLCDATGDARWLEKAKRAGDDLVHGQLPNGNYRNSCFELNPNTGGTPHEAACDLALLRLAMALRAVGDSRWEIYAQAAERNLSAFYVARLWDEAARSFRDDPLVPSFVPNKSATLAEALLAMTALTGDERWAVRYALPTLDAVIEHQVRGGVLEGAIYQNSFGARRGAAGRGATGRVAKFFPYYIARCVPGLLAGYALSHEARYAEAARQAAQFVARTRYPEGSFPQVIYPGAKVNRYPQWIAGAGDIARALGLARQAGVEFDEVTTLSWLLQGRRADGGFYTAQGFGRATPGGRRDDPRDALSVCGWADKAFRYFTGRVRPETLAATRAQA